MKGLCPFHDEKSPSFNVRPSHGAYHCFGCGEGGDVISFVMKLDGLSFVETVERLAEKYSVELKREVPEALKPRRIAIGGVTATSGQDNAPAQITESKVAQAKAAEPRVAEAA